MTKYIAEIEASSDSPEHARFVEIELEANDLSEAIGKATVEAAQLDGKVKSVSEDFAA